MDTTIVNNNAWIHVQGLHSCEIFTVNQTEGTPFVQVDNLQSVYAQHQFGIISTHTFGFVPQTRLSRDTIQTHLLCAEILHRHDIVHVYTIVGNRNTIPLH